MKFFKGLLSVSVALLTGAFSAHGQFNATVDTTTMTNGFGYFTNLDGSFSGLAQSWGVPALTGIPTSATIAQMGATQVDNGDSYWIVGGTGSTSDFPAPGATYQSNKISEATWYTEIGDGSLAGQSLTYSVNVTAFDLSSEYNAFLVIKESAKGYTPVTTAITGVGTFSVTEPAIAAGANFVQYGLMMVGPTVVPGDQFRNGSFTVTAVPEPSTWALMGGLVTFLFVAVRRYRGRRA